MKAHLKYLAYRIQESFWFLPALMTLAGLVLALVLPAYDQDTGIAPPAWLGEVGAAGAQQILSTIAGSMITVASLVFSLTMIALTLASQQLGPRLISTLISDRRTQVMLGVFVATFVYALLILRSFGSRPDEAYVPLYSLSVALLLAVTSVGILIYFIHHIALSMQADSLIARVADQLDATVARNFPERRPSEPSAEEGGAPPPPAAVVRIERLDPDGQDVRRLRSQETGYIQAVDGAGLFDLAKKQERRIELLCFPGSFVIEGAPLALIQGEAGDLPPELDSNLREKIVIGPRRTPTQDVEFSIHALVEVATRALSPGINDHYTAIACIDRLGAALAQILIRDMPRSVFRDDKGALRVTFKPLTLEGLMGAALDDIRVCARGLPIILHRLILALDRLVDFADDQAARDLLKKHAGKVGRAGEAGELDREDRADLRVRWDALDRRLGGTGLPWEKEQAA